MKHVLVLSLVIYMSTKSVYMPLSSDNRGNLIIPEKCVQYKEGCDVCGRQMHKKSRFFCKKVEPRSRCNPAQKPVCTNVIGQVVRR